MLAVSIASCIALGLAAPDAGGNPTALPPPVTDPVGLYGDALRFDIRRDGEQVGEFVMTFRGTQDRVIVESRAAIDVKLWFVSAYAFRYQAREVWDGDGLLSLRASTNDNGDYTHVEADRAGEGWRVRAEGETYETAVAVPTTHWNNAQLSSDVLLNTITGKLNRVTTERLGRETVATAFGDVTAHRFAYNGELETEVWYDDAGRWVKLRFRAEDGSTIDYLCRTCRQSTAAAAE
jgi:hypothetical protein